MPQTKLPYDAQPNDVGRLNAYEMQFMQDLLRSRMLELGDALRRRCHTEEDVGTMTLEIEELDDALKLYFALEMRNIMAEEPVARTKKVKATGVSGMTKLLAYSIR